MNTVLKTIGSFVFAAATYVTVTGDAKDPASFKARHPDVVYFAGALGAGLAGLGFKAPGGEKDESRRSW